MLNYYIEKGMDTTFTFGCLNTYIPVLAMIVIQYVYMAVFRESGKRAVDTSWYGKKEKRIVFWNFVFQILIIGVSFFVPIRFSFASFVPGVILYLLSLAGCIMAFHAYNAASMNEAVTRGVYRFSRNPQYFFYNLSLVAVFLMGGCSLWLLIAAIPFIVVLHLLILREEWYCKRTYGNAYLEYEKKTARYFLFF